MPTIDFSSIANCPGRFDDIDNMSIFLPSLLWDFLTGDERAIYILINIDGTSVVNNNTTFGRMYRNNHDKVRNTQIIDFCIIFWLLYNYS